MSSLENKVIIITGANAGIGEGIALHLSSNKPRLVLVARTFSRLKETKEKCAEQGLDKKNILTVVCDVEKDEYLSSLVETTIKWFRQIDGLLQERQSTMTPIGRIGEPEDVAKAVKLLLSDQAVL